MFVSLGSIIGSGWLLGALNAARVAGPASVLSWLLAGVMLSLLALTYAELGAAYPVAGGTARFSYYCHGPVAGFTAGWASWLQAVFIPPIEVLAAIQYVNGVDWVRDHFNMISPDGILNSTGLVIAIALMLLFTAINLAGGKFLSESNSVVVIWKAAVPLLAAIVVAGIQFEPSNFHAGGGFLPFGFHGVFAALTGGVVFGMQGFEQAVMLAGEAKDPKRDLARAILVAMGIGAVLYTLLQIVMIGGFDPTHITKNWDNPLGTSAATRSAWYTLALALGAGWLAKVLLIDAIVSPAGTGIVYVGAASRLSYALGEEREMPSALATTNRKGTPVVSILVAAVVGCLAFGPFKSWQALVNVVTLATAIMYGFAPISVAALHKLDPDRPRPYRVPAPAVTMPAAFCAANLIIYWSGFDATWKLAIAMLVGQLIFAVGAKHVGTGLVRTFRNALWIFPWLGGHVILGWLGRYGGAEVLGEWIDIAAVVAFSLAIYYVALRMTLSAAASAESIAKDAHQMDYEPLPDARIVVPPGSHRPHE
jgi:amino acid transporter